MVEVYQNNQKFVKYQSKIYRKLASARGIVLVFLAKGPSTLLVHKESRLPKDFVIPEKLILRCLHRFLFISTYIFTLCVHLSFRQVTIDIIMKYQSLFLTAPTSFSILYRICFHSSRTIECTRTNSYKNTKIIVVPIFITDKLSPLLMRVKLLNNPNIVDQ